MRVPRVDAAGLRNEGLARAGRTTRRIAGAAAAGTAVLAVIFADAGSGQIAAKPEGGAVSTTHGGSADAGAAAQGQDVAPVSSRPEVRPPTQPPAPAAGPAHVRSGGS